MCITCFRRTDLWAGPDLDYCALGIPNASGGSPCDSPNTSGDTSEGGRGGEYIPSWRVADCFVTYSIHQGVLSAFRFDASLRAHYNSQLRRYFLTCLTKSNKIRISL